MGWKARLGTPGCCVLLMRQLQKVQHEVLRLHPRLSSEGAAVAVVRISPNLGGLGHVTCLLGLPLILIFPC